MTAVAQKTVLAGCLAPIDKNGLEQLIANGKANPKVIKTFKCKTVAEGKFRHANYIRNLAAVWGTGDVSEKPVGFTDVRVKVDMECEGIPKSEIDALVTHVKQWSPVANTFTRPVNLEVSI